MNKSLVKNSLYNILYKVISVLYPLVAVTYVSHILKSDRMGMVSYSQNIVSYFVIFASLGIPTYGIREIAVCADNKKNRSVIFWELFSINFISTSLALLTYCCLIISVNRFSSQKTLYFVAGLQILFNYFNVDWFYQGIEEYKYISIRSIIVKIFAIVLLPIMVRKPDDYINYALIYCLAIAGNNIFNIIKLRHYILKPNKKLSIIRHLHPIAILLMASIAVEIYAMVDTTMLGFFCDDSIVGCYTNSMKLVRMVTTTSAAIGAVLFPRLSKMYNEDNITIFNELVNKGIKIMLVFAIPSAVGLILLRRNIVIVFFGDSFEGAIPILTILSVMIPIVVCNTIMGGQVLVTMGKETKYMFSVLIASILNVILNAIFIPKYGATSAAVASLISEFMVLILYLVFSRDKVKVKISFDFLASIIVPLALFVIISRFIIEKTITSIIINLIVNVVVCVIIYFGLGIILKNESMLFAFYKIKNIVSERNKNR